MKEIQAYVERVRQVSATYQHLEITTDGEAPRLKPGQSLLVRQVPDGYNQTQWDPYLRERWWPVARSGDNQLVVERPKLSRYEPGQVLQLLAPIGEPFRFRRTLRNVLLLAYNASTSPLMMMIRPLLRNDVALTLVLLGESVHHDLQHVPEEVEIIRQNKHLEWADQVMTLGWADQTFAVVGESDELLQFRHLYEMTEKYRNIVQKNFLFGVFQSNIVCGAGACSTCMVSMKKGMQRACVDGPAFDLSTVRLR